MTFSRNSDAIADRLIPDSREFMFIVLAILPFALIYIAHFGASTGIGTGFIQGDMPYYSANGREIFERGNGFAYPNPYDPSSGAPVIYFHWLMWLIGFGISWLGVDPGILFSSIGLIGALAMSWLTLCLVKQVLPDPRYQIALFLFVMWGGGLLSLRMLIGNLFSGADWDSNLLAYDPADGLWFLNWGRNIVFPTEAVYHALAAGCWLAVLRRRFYFSLLLGVLLAATHPWSGLETLLTLWCFCALMLFVGDRRNSTKLFLLSSLALAAFLAYNIGFLNAFESHRLLRETWQLDWSLSFRTIILAWLPLAVLAAIRITKERQSIRGSELFLITAFFVGFALSIHDRFIADPIQPAHFTRGYIWMPLALLALPLAQRWMIGIRKRFSRGVFAGAGVLLFVLLAFDNLVFVAVQTRIQSRTGQELILFKGPLYFESDEERALFAFADGRHYDGVVVSSDPRLNYLAATYTRLTPYAGHLFNTPLRAERVMHLESFFSGEDFQSIDWFNPVDFVILTAEESEALSRLGSAAWQPIYQNAGFTLYSTDAR